jgi:hypothetical protein
MQPGNTHNCCASVCLDCFPSLLYAESDASAALALSCHVCRKPALACDAVHMPSASGGRTAKFTHGNAPVQTLRSATTSLHEAPRGEIKTICVESSSPCPSARLTSPRASCAVRMQKLFAASSGRTTQRHLASDPTSSFSEPRVLSEIGSDRARGLAVSS